MRGVLLLFLILFIVLTKLSGVPERDDGPDIYVLALGATLGFCLMVAANHLMMVFLAVEMASVPSYALAGLLKRDRLSSEASLKYAVYGGGAAGIMLYGISLIAGLVNAVHLPTVAVRLSSRPAHDECGGIDSAGVGLPDDRGRTGLQALRSAVSLLVSGRI